MSVEAADLTADEIRAGLREFFAAHPGVVEVRRNRDADNGIHGPGFDGGRWRQLVAELGVIGIAAPANWGGMNLPESYLVALIEECGAALYPGPVRASLSTARALAELTPDAVSPDLRDVIDGFLDGGRIAGITPDSGAAHADFVDGRVSGTIPTVTHGSVADLVVAGVRTSDGPAVAIVAVPATATRREIRTADLAAPVADIMVDSAPAAIIRGPGDTEGRARRRDLDMLLLAAEQVGIAQGCLTEMTDYAGMREQFGARIGTYQGIAHRCADTAVSVGAARALVAAAAEAQSAGDGSATSLTLLARADAAEIASAAADALIQVSGGIGFTWAHDAHLYFRHARATAALGGTPSEIRDRAVEFGCLDLLTRPLAIDTGAAS